ncbi:MAG: polyphosphate:AMP phosphotransferase [Elusimicrobiota bacterium]
MFESAEIGAKVSKQDFKKEEPKLRTELLAIQKKLASADFPVILLVSGVEAAGKTSLVNLLLEWMDARGIEVHAPWDSTDEERERPRLWRFWRMLPPKGKMGVFLGSWYTDPIVDRVFKRMKDRSFEAELRRIRDLENMLTREGALIVKLWLHLSEKTQKKRLAKLAEDPDTSWRVTKRDWSFFERYDRFRRFSERALRTTSTGKAPWHVIEATDRHHTALTAAKTLARAVRARVKEAARPAPAREPDTPRPKRVNALNSLDYGLKLGLKEYKDRLAKSQARLSVLTRSLRRKGRSMILLFEGPDAAGKGGVIRRMTRAIDARLYRVISTAAPTGDERAHPHLWRFWRDLPRLGRVGIYDRSWYGRVLVERLEGFCAPEAWKRAYNEINDFEGQLTDFGIILVKFWIAITPEEQLSRFKDRKLKPYKQYKLTEEDWRNREKWGAYEAAACETIERTSTEYAPWTLVEGNDKRWARVKAIGTVVDRLGKELG